MCRSARSADENNIKITISGSTLTRVGVHGRNGPLKPFRNATANFFLRLRQATRDITRRLRAPPHLATPSRTQMIWVVTPTPRAPPERQSAEGLGRGGGKGLSQWVVLNCVRGLSVLTYGSSALSFETGVCGKTQHCINSLDAHRVGSAGSARQSRNQPALASRALVSNHAPQR